jgi:molybdopterin-guanine dinucleotide biosynthesis protein
MLLVVGGHARNIGKTTLATQILAATRSMRWTAMKITPHSHEACDSNDETRGTAGQSLVITEEHRRDSGTDTSRMLSAGARRVLWVRTQGRLSEAMPLLRQEIAAVENVLIESNSILEFVQPDLYAVVLDPSVEDFKPSALRYLDRADALFVPAGTHLSALQWKGIAVSRYQDRQIFTLQDDLLGEEALQWLTDRIKRIAEP